jgi:hypothetical protein
MIYFLMRYDAFLVHNTVGSVRLRRVNKAMQYSLSHFALPTPLVHSAVPQGRGQ